MFAKSLPFLFAALLFCASPRFTQAESFLLRSGGKIEGELLNPKRASADPYLVKIPSGLKLSLARETVAKVVVQREIVLEYERLLPKVPDTAEGHWKMAEWCREAGLRSQREEQLRQVLVHDTENEAAHVALGHLKLGGKWQSMEDYMTSLGYLKYEGVWRTQQDVELARSGDKSEDRSIAWRKQIRIWRSWIGKKREGEAYANIKAIRDPQAAGELIDLLQLKGQPRDLRMVAVDVLSELPGNPAEGTFIQLAMTDLDQGIRDACLDQLVRVQSKSAVHQYIGVLKSEKAMPTVINRAAGALGRLGDQIATLALIDALVTTHDVVVQPGSSSSGGLGPIASSFGSDAANPNSGGFSAGAPKPVKVKVESKNDAVLGALTALYPGTNFGFNKVAWKQWYAAKHTPRKIDLRRVD